MNTALRVIVALLAVIAVSAHGEPFLLHDHGHGLAFSSDGTALLAPSRRSFATFRDGAWSEVPGALQGFSGFAVTERAVYSSGHSPSGATPHSRFGLLKSVDGGRTWRPIALAGEADFPLVAAGFRSDAIYVLNTRPNPGMPSPGIYLSQDDGKSWRRVTARGVEGEVHGLAAHPRDAGTIAIATGRGLYLSRDAGKRFQRLDGRELATGVTFDVEGRRLRYGHALSNEIVEIALDGRERRVFRLPPLGRDYVTCLAQSPSDERVFAFATRRLDVYLTRDGGRTWRQIATEGDLRESADEQSKR
jgi:hypothetical protein